MSRKLSLVQHGAALGKKGWISTDTAWGMMRSYTPLSETGTICGKLIFRPSLIKMCATMQRCKS